MYKQLKYFVIDVDGTMTDGGIYYDEHGNETKKFNTKDAAGFFAARLCDIKTIVLTGRRCVATERRMEELKVDFVFQGVRDKAMFLKTFMQENKIVQGDIAYVGDDLNDLAPMKLVGFVACPNDACEEIKEIATYVSTRKGGEGAVRDILEYVIRKREQWEACVEKLYEVGK